MSSEWSGQYFVHKANVNISAVRRRNVYHGEDGEEEMLVQNFHPQDTVEGYTVKYPVTQSDQGVRNAGASDQDQIIFCSSEYQSIRLDGESKISIDGKIIYSHAAWIKLTKDNNSLDEESRPYTESPATITFWTSEQEDRMSAETASFQNLWASVNLSEYGADHEASIKDGHLCDEGFAAQMQPIIEVTLPITEGADQKQHFKGRLDCLTKHVSSLDDTVWTLAQTQQDLVNYSTACATVCADWMEIYGRLKRGVACEADDGTDLTPEGLEQLFPLLHAELDDALDEKTSLRKLVGLIPVKTDAACLSVDQTSREYPL